MDLRDQLARWCIDEASAHAFLLGVAENESDVTTHLQDRVLEAYDAGRALGRSLNGFEHPPIGDSLCKVCNERPCMGAFDHCGDDDCVPF